MPTTPLTLADVASVLTERIGLADHQIPDDPDVRFTEFGLDSLAVVEVQMGVEQLCGIEIPAADAESLTSPQRVLDYVNGRLTPVGS
jgi:acyl carrier protein